MFKQHLMFKAQPSWPVELIPNCHGCHGCHGPAKKYGTRSQPLFKRGCYNPTTD